MKKYRAAEYKIFNGKRYEIASQEMSKEKAKKLAKDLRSPVPGLKTQKARIVKEKYQKGYEHMQGKYRVYVYKRR